MLEDPFNPQSNQKPLRPRSTTNRSNLTLSKKRQYGDRFIPNRGGGLDLFTTFQLMDDAQSNLNSDDSNSGSKRAVVAGMSDLEKDEARRMFTNLLRAETFGTEQSDVLQLLNQSPSHSRNSSTVPNSSSPGTPRKSTQPNPNSSSIAAPSSKLFNFSSPSIRDRKNSISLDSPTHHRYSTTPIKYESQRMLSSPRKPSRALSKVPFKVLDAPDLADDYYLNLVDWSSTNVLGVGLGSQVYLWSASTSAVTRLVDVAQSAGSDHVTSLSWIGRGNVLAIGTDSGKVHIWDTHVGKRVRTMEGHESRIGCMDWNDYILSTGSRDRTIVHRDVRVAEHWVSRLSAHKQEVCGLKWNSSTNQLASGGNDNRLLIWEGRAQSNGPVLRFNDHTAAIKALSWSPHQNGLLASGGGSADKKIRFWNTLNGNLLNQIDTGSQVCSLKWSKNSNEIVSTHGFSPGPIQNQVCLWKYPSMQQIATLSGHTYRVLYLAMSPDGETIVTGAGDETLRFWHAFPKKTSSFTTTSLISSSISPSNSSSSSSSATTNSTNGCFGIGSLNKFGGSFGGVANGVGGGNGGVLNLFAQMR
ncbi:WD40-repeat-containing domain protein [Phakopsora pachyrhizi]|nr:WD40-repeat-containing domain protein [Phakopsora pachyrhizi]